MKKRKIRRELFAEEHFVNGHWEVENVYNHPGRVAYAPSDKTRRVVLYLPVKIMPRGRCGENREDYF